MNVVEQQDKSNPYFTLVFYYIPWISSLVIIFSLSSQPREVLPVIDIPLIDKFAHLLEYGILGIFTLRVFSLWSEHRFLAPLPLAARLYILPFIFVFLFALTDELHQIPVPGRTFDLADLVTDLVAMLLVIVVYKKLAGKTISPAQLN